MAAHISLCLLLLLQCLGTSRAQFWDWDDVTPLDEYVNRPDENYGYELLMTQNAPGATVYVYNMTSQKWMDEDYIDRPVWWHQVSVAIPDNPQIFDASFMFVDGGQNNDDIDENHSGIVRMARETGAVAIRIMQTLNEPLYFADDPDVARTQDEIIARTQRHFIEDDTLPGEIFAVVPMVKAAKMALDTAVTVTAEIDGRFAIDKVLPYGISKYGWTSWLLAATDPRVFAVAPVVLDLLDYNPNFHHHYQLYGGWSWAMNPYWAENTTMYVDHPRNLEMAQDVATDPFRYNPRLTMPKLLPTATGDAFFPISDSHYFFDELLPPKYMMVLENVGHLTAGMYDRLEENIQNLFETTYYSSDFPELSWQRSETETDGALELQTDRDPLTIQAFWADTGDDVCITDPEPICRRDFRLITDDGPTGIFWEEDSVEDLGDNLYRVTYDKRQEDGYRAFFISMTFPGENPGQIFDTTTEIHVLPDTLPFPQCSNEAECRGVLV